MFIWVRFIQLLFCSLWEQWPFETNALMWQTTTQSLPYFSQLTRCWSLEHSSVLPTPMTTLGLWPSRQTNLCCGQWLSRDKISYSCLFWSDTTQITTKSHWIKTVKLLQDISKHWFSVLNGKQVWNKSHLRLNQNCLQ